MFVLWIMFGWMNFSTCNGPFLQGRMIHDFSWEFTSLSLLNKPYLNNLLIVRRRKSLISDKILVWRHKLMLCRWQVKHEYYSNTVNDTMAKYLWRDRWRQFLHLIKWQVTEDHLELKIEIRSGLSLGMRSTHLHHSIIYQWWRNRSLPC